MGLPVPHPPIAVANEANISPEVCAVWFKLAARLNLLHSSQHGQSLQGLGHTNKLLYSTVGMVLDFLGVGFQVYSQRVYCRENRSLCYTYICHGTHIKKKKKNCFSVTKPQPCLFATLYHNFYIMILEHIRDASRHQQLIMSIP